MKETKEKQKDYTIPFLILVGICVIIISCSVTYYYCTRTEKSNESIKDKINIMDNFNNNTEAPMGKYCSLEYEKTKNSNEEKSEVKEFYVNYYYNQENKGKLFINNKEVNTSKVIKDIYEVTEYDGMAYEDLFKPGEKYEYKSELYILFEDGTVGKIDTDNIKKNNYNINMLEKCIDIQYFTEVSYLDSGIGSNLYGVNSKGVAIKLAEMNFGN